METVYKLSDVIIGGASGGMTEPIVKVEEKAVDKKKKTWLWVGMGAVALILILVIIVMFRKR